MNNKYIVYTDMVGDLCHPNHIKHLKKCKKFKKDCLLYVGLHSDEISEKWKRKPIMSLEERVYMFEAIKYVDKVIPNAPIIITEEFLNINNIDMVIHAHSEEEDKKYFFQHKYAIKLGKFTRFNYNNGISTTNIIKRIYQGNYNI